MIRRVIHFAANAIAFFAVCWLFLIALVTPWHTRWGSTEEELHAALPGDEALTGRPTYWLQHAITIRAPAEEVWPWLAQIGTDKGGFYSYAWLENLFGISVRNADRIHPEWQSVETGGFVLAAPAGYLGFDKPSGWKITLAQTNRALVLENWGAFVLLPLDRQSTRLIVRTRNSHPVSWLALCLGWADQALFEPAHFIMQRKMLLGIRERAEKRHQQLSTPVAVSFTQLEVRLPRE